MADEKKGAHERRYGKPEEAAEPKEETNHEPKDAPVEGKPEVHKRQADERKEMRHRHEKEHRDLHGQHREAMRDMHSRQEGEMRAMNQRQDQELGGQAEPTEPLPDMGSEG